MASKKDPNLISIDDLLNTTNIDPNYKDDSDGEIESRITDRKEIEKKLDVFAEDGSISSSSSDLSESTKADSVKESSGSYKSEVESTVPAETLSIETSLDDHVSEQSYDSIENIFFNKKKKESEIKESKEVPRYTSPDDRNHKKILSGIYEYENEYFDTINIKVPKYDRKKILKDKVYAEEIYSMLDDMYNNNSLAMDMREVICLSAQIVDFVFDGEENKLFKTEMPNLKGYSNEVRRNINQMKKETVIFAGKLTSTNIGANLSYMFKIFKIFGLPLFTVYNNNRKKKENVKQYNYSVYDSDDETDESSSD